MGKWDYELDIQEAWTKAEELMEEVEYEKARTVLVKRLEELQFNFEHDEDMLRKFEDWIDELKMVEDVEEFDYSWNEFLNWADEERVWVKTIF